MYDRPTLLELIDAVRAHMENHVAPTLKSDAKLYFQTLVAVNLLRVAERELLLRDDHLRAEWERVNSYSETPLPLPADSEAAYGVLSRRYETLCEGIRRGEFDENIPRAVLFAHLMATTREQLEVATPRYLQLLEQEDAAQTDT